MKIGYIGIKGLPSQAGADRVVEAIVGRLAERHQVTVYCSSLEVAPSATYPGVELVRIPILSGKHVHAPSLFLASAAHAVARRHFDLVHVHNVEACFVLPLLRLKYKVMATSHGQAYARDKWGSAAKALIRLADWPYIRLADDVTSVSKPLADYYAGRYGRDVAYIPNGIGREELSLNLDAARALLASHGIGSHGYLLFAAGRIIPTKGGALLLKAFRQLEAEHRLLIVGDSSHSPAHRRELQDLADSRVTFIPPVDSRTLFGLVRLARLFVFPSTVEAMSMMLIEAASLGAPIVCSDIPENTAILPQQALFFATGDPADLREKLRWAVSHAESMKRLGSEARAWIAENYRWDSIVEQYEQRYRALVGHSEGGSNFVAAV